MNFQPLYDKVIARSIDSKEMFQKKDGIIFIPETARETPFLAEVLAIGQGIMTQNGDIIPLRVKAGDIVAYNTLSQTCNKFNDGNEDLIMMRESDIWAIVNVFSFDENNKSDLIMESTK